MFNNSVRLRKVTSCNKWISNKLLLVFLVLSLIFSISYCVIPSRPIVVSPNTESSPSNFIFNFVLQKQLQSTGYLLINFSPLIPTAVTPKSCLVISTNVSSLSIKDCQNLDVGSSAGTLTINNTWINQINPNILPSQTITVQFNQNLLPNVEYSIQIITNNVLPAIGSITSDFEMYTISSTGFMLQENWNFGQVYFQYRQNNILNVNSINDLTQNYPGTLSSNLQFEITISVNCPTPYSVIKFIISNDFQFSASSLVNVQGILSSAPQVISTTIISPNIIVTRFGESFISGRKFQVSITDIVNPLKISAGFVSVYYLPDNSMSPLEIKELAIGIGTKQYVPTIGVLTGEGIQAFSPVQFYQQKQQYLTVTVTLPRQFNSNFIVQVLTDTLTIEEGSAYAKSDTTIASKLIYDHYDPKGVRISGFPNMTSGTKITITMKAYIPVTPSFNIQVSIDQIGSILTPIIQGNAATVDTIVPDQYISGLTGTQGEPNKLTSVTSAVASPYSSITFVVTPTYATQMGSSLKIYTCENLIKASAFDPSSSCVVGGVNTACTLVTNDTITLITINSGSSNNLFVQGLSTTVTINDLQFRFLSSNTEYIYQFYFQLTLSESSSNLIIKKTVQTPQVIPQRPANSLVNTGFTNYFSNDLYNTGTNYPNVFRIVSTVPAQWNYIVQSTQRRMLTVFHKQTWNKLFTTLKSGDSYPFLCSMPGVTSTFIQGTTSQSSLDFPLTWDQLHFILPGDQNTTTFSIAIPTTYISANILTDNEFHFQIMSGIYNTETRVITYRAIEMRPVAGSRTYKQFLTVVAVGAKPKQSTTKILLAGNAGSYKNDVQATVQPATSGSFSGTSFSTSLIILSTWNWFDSTTMIDTANISSASPGFPIFTNDHQKPLSLQLSNSSYLTYIPFTRTGPNITPFNVYFDSVKLPYTHDLPYYSMLLIDETGTIDSYNQFINQDQGVFYSTILKSLTFSCSDNSLGVTNTDCSLVFVPNQQIEVSSTIYVALTGLTVSTNKCILTKNSDGSVIPNTCSSNTDKNQLIVSLNSVARLPDSTNYTLKIYGMSIDPTTIIQYADMTIRDQSGGYIIEQGTRILITSVSSYFPIYIQQMTYLKNNPIVVSGFTIIFTLPRQLNNDEVFAVVMGNDLSNLNYITSKLKIRLYYHLNNTQIPNVRWFLNTKNYQIIFQDLHSYLGNFKFRLQIYGLKTPSTIGQNVISLIYLRTFDNSYTVQNTNSSTATYPSLVDKINSLITMKPYLNTQGIQQPLDFNITGQHAKVDSNTVWYITLPRYYSQPIWNQNYLAYCTINYTKLDCSRHEDIPYTIIVKNSPKIIDINSWYILSIHGITCPRSTYVNGNPNYVTDSIFFGIALNDSSQSYVQYSELFMTQTVIDPQSPSGYGAITAKQVLSSNSETYQTTYFSVKLTSTVAVSPNDYMFITFPEGFDNFNDLDMEGNIVYGGVKTAITASVVNTKITFQIPSNVTIAANNDFSIQISSLPTPTSPISIDMNKMTIVLAPSSKMTTKASSLQLHNQVSTLTFVTSQLHLVINNYQPIQLIAGTCSNPIKIESSDHSKFLSNIKVQFISNSLTFSPNPLSLYLGDNQGYFTICGAQNLIPTIYTYSIIKSQSSISAFYTALSTYSVSVVNNPISVIIPSSLTIPKGGCSIPVYIELSIAPTSDVTINFEYNSDIYKLDSFWINEEVSYNELSYNQSVTGRYLSFCCSSNFSYTTVPVNVYFSGTNEDAYILSTDNFTVSIVSNTSTVPPPSLAIQVLNTQKTYAKLQVSTNLAGLLYYELKLSPLTNPIDIVTLKYEIKQTNTTIESQQDFINKQIYTTDRDHRINLITLNAGNNYVELQNLLPQRSYSFCSYFQNQHRNITQQICTNFTMQTWGPIIKSYIKFKYNIQQNQLNNILCYFVKTSQSHITQIISLEGKSCSLNNSASNYYFNFLGQVNTNELSSTIIYHISDQNLTTDPSNSAFTAMYDASGLTNSSLAAALSDFSIAYINASYSLGNFDPLDPITFANDNFKPVASFDIQSYQSGSSTITIKNVHLSKAGSVYFILTPYKKLIRDQIAGHTDIEIRPLIIPTVEQILNCLDGYNANTLSCQRIVLKQGDSIDIQLTGVESDHMYAAFYVVANEYPMRPVVYGDVQKVQLVTVLLSQYRLMYWMGLLILFYMLM